MPTTLSEPCHREPAAFSTGFETASTVPREGTGRPDGFESIIGDSEAIVNLLRQARRAAETESTVLITGESGTGKELLAQAIPHYGSRASGPRVTINMAAVPEALVESELFGHKKGAFTGASADRVGRFEAADGGTLFIDEIGDLALPSQAKLLRVLEGFMISPVGGNNERPVDVRLIAATSRCLEDMIEAGDFREDLYYRLNVVNLHIPPLRERPGDVSLLLRHFLGEHAARCERPPLQLDPELEGFLIHHPWPGNVRQLRNCVESMVVLAEGNWLTMDNVPASLKTPRNPEDHDALLRPTDRLCDLERKAIIQRLNRFGGNQQRAAESLGISARTIQRKLRKWHLNETDFN